ncbi:hypothetical protein PanWU01x14_140880 [Parasponia andersonii]|uniref:Uncharacterized protein n=1 Tax=Parasponia andersonii TaxID=3476 RepID=A0A2P5CM58_PARAD|nr:hypothetical protein PanWU01x14_140880 [Parasponia andersonii]
MNVDAAVCTASQTVGFGSMTRDCTGEVIGVIGLQRRVGSIPISLNVSLRCTAIVTCLSPCTSPHLRAFKDEANAIDLASFRRLTKPQRLRKYSVSNEIFQPPERYPTSIFNNSCKWSLVSSSLTNSK